MSVRLEVFREYRGQYQHVGSLIPAENETGAFVYAPEYLVDDTARSISVALPLQREAFSPKATRAFFEGLLPEGELRQILAESLRTNTDAYLALLARLNHESIGALVFSTDPTELISEQGYEEFGSDALRRFAEKPTQVALDATLHSRLSLAGAQTKIGLYHKGDDPQSGWYLPQGLAPSTHILKASSSVFPRQTLNEALCLHTARLYGFETAESFLVSAGDAEPLLAIRRFDRVTAEDAQMVNGLLIPRRSHQEDLCQAADIPSFMKYEPTDGHYLALVTRVLDDVVARPLEDRMIFFERVLFDYLIGNCDNHLKNYSLLWEEDWFSCRLAPLYDVTCTKLYPNLAREMGIALCESRRIDDVRGDDIRRSARRVGITESAGWQLYLEAGERFLDALRKAERALVDQGFTEVTEIAQFIIEDSEPRRRLSSCPKA